MNALWLLLACQPDGAPPWFRKCPEDQVRVEPHAVTANGLTAEEVITDAMAGSSQLRIDWSDGLEPATTTLDVTWTAEPTQYFDWSTEFMCSFTYTGVTSPVAARFTDEQGMLIAEGFVVVGQSVADDEVSDTLLWVDLPAITPSVWPQGNTFEPVLRTHRLSEVSGAGRVHDLGISLAARSCLSIGCVTWVR